MSRARRLFFDPTKSILLTLDAFGTLYRPRQSIASIYARTAREHGLTGFSDGDVDAEFRKAFKMTMTEHPNYGKSSEMTPYQWWTNIIRSTFSPYASTHEVPSKLIAELWDIFSTSRGYTLMPEVAPFFKKLANLRRAMNSKPFPRVTLITGIVTNSDDRVSSILTNLGLRVNTARRAQQDELSTLVNKFDLDFTTTSYDVGHTKPAKEIFEAAFGQSGYSTSEKVQCVHIGDDLVKDVQGADQAGWESALLLPSNPSVTYVPHQDPSIRQTSLQLLHSELGSWWSKVASSPSNHRFN